MTGGNTGGMDPRLRGGDNKQYTDDNKKRNTNKPDQWLLIKNQSSVNENQ